MISLNPPGVLAQTTEVPAQSVAWIMMSVSMKTSIPQRQMLKEPMACQAGSTSVGQQHCLTEMQDANMQEACNLPHFILASQLCMAFPHTQSQIGILTVHHLSLCLNWWILSEFLTVHACCAYDDPCLQ